MSEKSSIMKNRLGGIFLSFVCSSFIFHSIKKPEYIIARELKEPSEWLKLFLGYEAEF